MPPVAGGPAAPSPGRPATGGGSGPTGRQPLYGPDFAADPQGTYRRMRASGSVAPVELAPGVEAWLVLDYRAALEVLRNADTFSKDSRRWRALEAGEIPPDSPVLEVLGPRPTVMHLDGEEHQRLRHALTDSLGRVDPNVLRGYVERNADVLIDGFAPDGSADLIGQYVQPLLVLVVNELFGAPNTQGNRMAQNTYRVMEAAEAKAPSTELMAFMAQIVRDKRHSPGADVTSWLMAHPEELSDEEVLHTINQAMCFGGYSLQNLITSGLRLLMSDDRFAGDLSGGTLPVDDALDEVLWHDTPTANLGVHFPVRDVEFHGTRMRRGDPVLVSFAAASADPALTADNRTGNRAHLAWSAGRHACPAQGPARLVATAVIEKLLDRLPDVELAKPAGELEWSLGPFHRALAALPVRFPPAPLSPAAGAASTPGSAENAEGAGTTSDPAAPAPATAAPTTAGRGHGSPSGTTGRARGLRGLWRAVTAWWRGREG